MQVQPFEENDTKQFRKTKITVSVITLIKLDYYLHSGEN
jgi:hypothetical protein